MDINLKFCLLKLVFLKLVLQLLISGVTTDRCRVLTAETSVHSFTSHEGYGFSPYSDNMFECWVITAPSGFAVRAYSSGIDLESCCDYITIRCGDSGNGRLIGRYTDVEHSFDVVSSGRSMYFLFTSDSSVTQGGFQIYYTYTSSNDHDCESSSSDNGDNSSNDTTASTSSSWPLSYILPPIIFIVIMFVVVFALRCFCVARYGTQNRRRMHFGQAASIFSMTNRQSGGHMSHNNLPSYQSSQTRTTSFSQRHNNTPPHHSSTSQAWTSTSPSQHTVDNTDGLPTYQSAQSMMFASPPPYGSFGPSIIWSTSGPDYVRNPVYQQNAYAPNEPSPSTPIPQPPPPPPYESCRENSFKFSDL